MSTIGNINGGGGNLDFSYRSKVLKGLQKSVDGLQLINANTGLLAGLATEGTLQSVLAAIQNGTDYEAKLVVDSNDDTWLEVRIWNTGSQTFDPPIYYAAGSNIVGIPVAPITYINPTTLLSQIASNTTGISLEATQLSVLTELQSLNVTAGNLATEATLLALSTWITTNAATEATLNSLLTAFNTTDFATETTLSSVDTTTTNAYTELLKQGLTLDDIETALNTLNSIAATEITLQSLLTELISVNLNIGNLSEEATQLLVLAALNTVISNTTGLSTEASLSALLTAFNAENFATETTLALIEAATTQLTFTGNDLNVSANMQVGGVDVSGANPVPITGTVISTPSGIQDVNIVSGVTLEVNLDQTNDQVQVYGSDLTAPIATDTSGHLQVDILTIPEVEIKNDIGNPIPVSDAGGSLTVDGTVALDGATLSALENITVQNGAGAAAVNIQDGGNSITVDDGGSSITVAGTVNVANFPANVEISNDVGNPIPVNGTVGVTQTTSPWVVSGTVTATPTGTQDVNIISTIALPVTDNGGSLTVDGTVAATQSGTWNINNVSGTISLPTGAATETTLNAVDTKLSSVVVTPSLIRATGAGTISAGAYSFSVANVGLLNGILLGVSIKPGEIISFDAGSLNNTYGAVSYDGTGTELLITVNS